MVRSDDKKSEVFAIRFIQGDLLVCIFFIQKTLSDKIYSTQFIEIKLSN